MLGNFTFYWILQSSSYLVTRLLREDTALTAIMVLLVSRRQRQLLSRLEKVSRKSTAQVNRKKTSRKRCSRRLLPAEKEHLRRTRAQNRRALEEAINAAHETMWELAEAMAAKFGKHDATYYFRLCMQRPTKQLNGRRPNKWNAYLHGEVRRRNEGMHCSTRCAILNVLTSSRATQRDGEVPLLRPRG